MSDIETAPSLPSRSRLLITAVWIAVLTSLNMLLAVLFVGIVPASKRTFDQFNLQLPGPTKFAVQLGDWYADSWYTVVPLALAVIIGGVLAGRHLFRRTWPGNVFATLCLFLLVFLLVVTVGGLWMAHAKLEEGLMK